MSIEAVRIESDQAEKILHLEETHFLDLKSADVSPAKLSKAISSFANSSGGDIYIGIDEIKTDDLRHWRGFSNQEAANGHIQLFEELFPLGQDYSYTFLAADLFPGLVLQVTINKVSKIVVASDKVPYIRRGAQSLPVKTDEGLTRLKREKGIESYEKETVNVDLEAIADSFHMIQFLQNVVPTAIPEAWLRKQWLIQQGKPTVAGVLLFADEPQAILPKQCGIKIYRYKTKDSEGSRDSLAFTPITIEGCLYQQIKEAVNQTVEIVEDIPKISSKGFERVHYPREAIHEIITNAVLHRDYSFQTDIQIRIFDNRIEVESPGRLPGHVTPQNILREQFARNGALVRIINKFPDPPNQDVGEGLNTAFIAMGKLRLKPPAIYEFANSVIVYIKHEPLASVEAMIIEFLESNDEITSKIARELTKASADAVKAALRKLRDSGVVRLRSRRWWRKVKEGDEQLQPETSLSEQYPIYEVQIMEYLEIHNRINSRTGRKITGIQSTTTMRDLFYKMRAKGLIELVPNKASTKIVWIKK